MIVAEQTSLADAAADWPAPTARADAAEADAAQRAGREVVSGQQDTQRDDGQRVTHDGSVALGPLYTIAALYVDPAGVYSNLPGVEVWDEQRDARLYDGPWPVVAHPPCARWCAIAHLVEARYGYKVGDDGGCFEAALRAVRTFGGVLEHPAYSKAWQRFGLPRPPGRGWQATIDGELVCELDQHAYGFPARKRTWLYAVGITPAALAFAIAPHGLPVVSRWGWSRPGAHFKDEYHTIRPHKASRTPEAFRDALIEMARSVALHDLSSDSRSRRLPRERGKVADVNGLTTPPAGARAIR